ncbi:MAG: hypothetical protein AAGJ38_05460 [Planctomycetota bacterium]
MQHRSPTRFCLILPLLLTACLTGCVKFKHALTVKPDGSGKVEITFAMGEAMQAQQSSEDLGLADLDELIAQEDHGFVAFTAPETWNQGGFAYQRIIGYFEDVNQVVIEGENDPDAEGAGVTTFAFDPAAGTLSVSRCLLQQVAVETESVVSADPAELTMLGAMMGGLRIEESITVPGQIEDAGPFGVEGSAASAVIDADVILAEDAATLNAWRETGEVVVRFVPTDWGNAEQEAWQEELTAAKAAWAAIKEAGTFEP